MSQYTRGRRLEWEVRDDLTLNGYEVLRTAGSKGAVDLIGVKPGEILMVQVKGDGTLPPAGWNRLFDLAAMVDAIPILAERLPRSPIRYFRLLARKTKPGRQPFELFLLDRVECPDE